MRRYKRVPEGVVVRERLREHELLLKDLNRNDFEPEDEEVENVLWYEAEQERLEQERLDEQEYEAFMASSHRETPDCWWDEEDVIPM
jgi:hypothetical protein